MIRKAGTAAVFAAFFAALALNSLLAQEKPTPAAQTGTALQGQAAAPKLDRLRLQIERLIAREDGVVGVAVKHLESGLALAVNDCGVLFLPEGAGTVALSIFTKNFTGDTSDVEAVIAKIARFAYDAFYFTM